MAKRHLKDDGIALYDISSSYYEGRTCHLIEFGHNRDLKKGKKIIVTVPDQVEKLSGRFALSRVILIGDRGMVTQTQIENIKKYPGIGWISALR